MLWRVYGTSFGWSNDDEGEASITAECMYLSIDDTGDPVELTYDEMRKLEEAWITIEILSGDASAGTKDAKEHMQVYNQTQKLPDTVSASINLDVGRLFCQCWLEPHHFENVKASFLAFACAQGPKFYWLQFSRALFRTDLADAPGPTKTQFIEQNHMLCFKKSPKINFVIGRAIPPREEIQKSKIRKLMEDL